MNVPGGVSYHLHQFYWVFLDLFFPARCAGCGVTGTQWCAACQDRIQFLDEPGCLRCGGPLQTAECDRCLRFPAAFDRVRSVALYQSPLSDAIIQLKYDARGGFGDRLAFHLIAFLQQVGWQIDRILPVPLGEHRLRERGYNQADLLARPLSRYYSIRYLPQALQRTKETASQVGLSAGARQQNVSGAFQANEKLIAGCNVLLVDDVFTTGATLNACARALREGGAGKVYGLTLARALDPSDHVEQKEP